MIGHDAFVFEITTLVEHTMNRMVYPGVNCFPGHFGDELKEGEHGGI